MNPGMQAARDVSQDITEYGPSETIVSINGGNPLTSGATVSKSGTLLTYTAPGPSTNTSDSFTYQVDRDDDSGTISVILNQAPTLDALSAQTAVAGATSGPIALPWADVNFGADPDYNETETFTSDAPSWAGISFDAEGNMTISPTDGPHDTITVTVRVTDSGGLYAEQTFDLKVLGVPQIDFTPPGTDTYSGSAFVATGDIRGTRVGIDDAPAQYLDGVPLIITYYSSASPGGTTTAPTDVGVYTVVASFAGSTNYAPASSAPATFMITPQQVDVTISSVTGGTGPNPENWNTTFHMVAMGTNTWGSYGMFAASLYYVGGNPVWQLDFNNGGFVDAEYTTSISWDFSGDLHLSKTFDSGRYDGFPSSITVSVA